MEATVKLRRDRTLEPETTDLTIKAVGCMTGDLELGCCGQIFYLSYWDLSALAHAFHQSGPPTVIRVSVKGETQ